jgi:hypothetical protein
MGKASNRNQRTLLYLRNCRSRRGACQAGAVSSNAAELATVRSQVEELTRRVEVVADQYRDTADSQLAADLYTAERQLIGARRAIEKVITSLGG